MNPDFLLTSPLARQLYHSCVAALPIIDYHNHLSPAELTSTRPYRNITELWIASDPYKHRAMRILGVEERLITGDATDFEKFQAWYESLPRLVGNPLFDWTAMELNVVFGMELLPFRACKEVWEELNRALETVTPGDILSKFNIAYSAPCAAIADDLSLFNGKDLAPSLRGDDLLLPSRELLGKLEALTGRAIRSLSDYLAAAEQRLEAFYQAGCRFTDHSLDSGFVYLPEDGKNDLRFAALLQGETPEGEDSIFLRSEILKRLAGLYAKKNLTLQLHIGAQRSTSTRLRRAAGAAGGYAGIGCTVDVGSLVSFLDDVEKQPQGLPRVLLFTLNPADNAVMSTLSGSFSADGKEALVSQGPAWWWCDHYQGIRDMLDNFCCHSVLSSFVGMTTDSRSILSFVRHDYFRRCLCQWMSDMVENHRLPNDMGLLEDTLRRICYQNAHNRLIDNVQ